MNQFRELVYCSYFTLIVQRLQFLDSLFIVHIAQHPQLVSFVPLLLMLHLL